MSMEGFLAFVVWGFVLFGLFSCVFFFLNKVSRIRFEVFATVMQQTSIFSPLY